MKPWSQVTPFSVVLLSRQNWSGSKLVRFGHSWSPVGPIFADQNWSRTTFGGQNWSRSYIEMIMIAPILQVRTIGRSVSNFSAIYQGKYSLCIKV